MKWIGFFISYANLLLIQALASLYVNHTLYPTYSLHNRSIKAAFVFPALCPKHLPTKNETAMHCHYY